MEYRGHTEHEPGLNGAVLSTGTWNQKAIDNKLNDYKRAFTGREIVFEQLCRMLRAEVVLNLKAELKNDIAIEEAEFASFRELERRLQKGKIKFLSKKYVKQYICSTAIRFVRQRHVKIVPLDSGEGITYQLEDPSAGPHEKDWLNHTDLYFCLKKLGRTEVKLLELHHFEGFKLDETAKRLKIQHDTARKRHGRALKKLRLCLEELIGGGVHNA